MVRSETPPADDSAQVWRWRGMWTFAIASLLAVGLGALTMAQEGIPPGLWARNLVAWVVAGGAGVLLARRGRIEIWATPAALILVALSLVSPGLEGVHRWLQLGPLQLNAAALVLPVAIATFSRPQGRMSQWFTLAGFGLIAGLLASQPDISQLTAFSLPAIVLCAARFGFKGALAGLVVAAAAISFCLPRPDPLLPVPHVEEIFTLASSQSPLLATAMAASLAVAALSPLLLWPVPSRRWAAVALAAYFAVSAPAFVFGAYPVPLAGYGLSFVIGWWLGVAALFIPPRRPHADNID